MQAGAATRGLGALVVLLATLAVAGSPMGFGPLARPVAAWQVSDPDEMLARSAQTVLDATSLQLDASVTGVLPAGLVPGKAGPVRLDGAAATILVRPADVTSRATLTVPALDATLETVSSWDTLWTRPGPDAPWSLASLGGIATDAGVDANPLTLVDRLRAYLARPGVVPRVDDVACPGEPAQACRRIVLDAGEDAVTLLAVLLPDDASTPLPDVDARITTLAERQTLRPLRVTVEVRSADRSVDLVATVTTSRWDDPSIVIEVPDAGP